MHRITRTAFTAAALTLGAALPSPALAQDDGVTLDDSPAGKEYSLPLEQARKESSKERKQTRTTPRAPSASADDAPLFGEGITTPTSAAPAVTTGQDAAAKRKAAAKRRAAAAKRRAAKARREAAERAERERARTTETTAAEPLAVSSPSDDGDGGGGGLALLGGAAAVVVIGALGGALFRRRQGLDDPTTDLAPGS